MAQKRISEASAAELRAYAATHLGIEVDHRWGAHTTVAKMRQAGFDGDTVEVPDAPPGGVQGKTEPVAQEPKAKAGGREYRTIYIPAQDKPGGNEPVFVAVNGRGMWIPRNEDVRVPMEYVEALRHAEEWQYDVREDGLGLRPPRPVLSYPFQTVA